MKDSRLEKIIEKDALLVQTVQPIKILGSLLWPADAETRFLDSWRAGNPELPDVQLKRKDYSKQIEALTHIQASCDRGDPLDNLIFKTARSYTSAARMLSAMGTPDFTKYQCTCGNTELNVGKERFCSYEILTRCTKCGGRLHSISAPWEIKVTRLSSKNFDPYNQEAWIKYMKCVCRVLGVVSYNLVVLFLMGDYRENRQPVLKTYTFQFTESEVMDAWGKICAARDEFRENLVLALEFVFEGSDLAVLGVLQGLVAFAGVGEGRGPVLEELFLPEIEEVDVEVVLLTDVRDGLLLQEVEAEQGDLLLGGERTTLTSHDKSSARVLPLTLTKAKSSSG